MAIQSFFLACSASTSLLDVNRRKCCCCNKPLILHLSCLSILPACEAAPDLGWMAVSSSFWTHGPPLSSYIVENLLFFSLFFGESSSPKDPWFEVAVQSSLSLSKSNGCPPPLGVLFCLVCSTWIYYSHYLNIVFFQVVLWNIPCERQSHRLRKAFFSAILRQEIAWFDTHQSGELTSRLAE